MFTLLIIILLFAVIVTPSNNTQYCRHCGTCFPSDQIMCPNCHYIQG